jgi:hypothetical protein
MDRVAMTLPTKTMPMLGIPSQDRDVPLGKLIYSVHIIAQGIFQTLLKYFLCSLTFYQFPQGCQNPHTDSLGKI